ncbi:hypothetical protein ATKI12_5059 [Kitasatospora sp. Ki12]
MQNQGARPPVTPPQTTQRRSHSSHPTGRTPARETTRFEVTEPVAVQAEDGRGGTVHVRALAPGTRYTLRVRPELASPEVTLPAWARRPTPRA